MSVPPCLCSRIQPCSITRLGAAVDPDRDDYTGAVLRQAHAGGQCRASTGRGVWPLAGFNDSASEPASPTRTTSASPPTTGFDPTEGDWIMSTRTMYRRRRGGDVGRSPLTRARGG